MRLPAPLAALFAAFGGRPATPTPEPAPPAPDEVYRNPVDGKSYVAEGGWVTHAPPVPRPRVGPSAQIVQVRLLTSEADLATRTATADLATFVKAAERVVAECLDAEPGPARLMVQFTCTPGGHDVQLGHQGALSREALQRTYDAVVAAARLPVSSGEAVFQVELELGGAP